MSTLKPTALQLYTVRREIANDFQGVLRKIADIGYIGIEGGLNFFADEQKDHLQIIRDLGLQLPSAGLGKLPIDESSQRLMERAAQAGCKYVMLSLFAGEFQDIESIKAAAQRLNEADEIVRSSGLTLCYHNHWWEFESRIDGRSAYDILRENAAPTVNFEVDMYWVQTGGGDPLGTVKELGSRAPLLHVKDGPAVKGQPMTAAGEGKVDITSIVHASQDHAKWLIVELDECATDIMEAVEKSYTYLIKEGLAYGNKG